MPIHNHRPSAQSAPQLDEADKLVQCRLAMVGLHSEAIQSEYAEAFDKIRQRCGNCGFRASCAAEILRDPYSLAWEGYCPNSAAVNALVAINEAIC
jgi:hypothetical protein